MFQCRIRFILRNFNQGQVSKGVSCDVQCVAPRHPDTLLHWIRLAVHFQTRPVQIFATHWKSCMKKSFQLIRAQMSTHHVTRARLELQRVCVRRSHSRPHSHRCTLTLRTRLHGDPPEVARTWFRPTPNTHARGKSVQKWRFQTGRGSFTCGLDLCEFGSVGARSAVSGC